MFNFFVYIGEVAEVENDDSFFENFEEGEEYVYDEDYECYCWYDELYDAWYWLNEDTGEWLLVAEDDEDEEIYWEEDEAA